MLLRLLLCRQLGNDNGGEHNRTTDIFDYGHSLAENNEREYNRENRFGTQKHTCERGLGIFLTDDLECESTAAAHYTCIKDRYGSLHNIADIGLFKNKHKYARNNAGNKVLTAGKNDGINFRCILVNHDDVKSKCD